MKITFLGATHEVTGSCTLIETNGKNILIDCGMEQGADIFVNQDLPVNSANIDCVFLTHAHIDHSGKLPLLCKNGFNGKIYATEATVNLCKCGFSAAVGTRNCNKFSRLEVVANIL